MKIAIACDVLGKENNGTTIATMNVVRHLISMGDEVRIICPDQDKKNLDNYFILPILKFGPLINKYLAKNDVILALPKKKIIEDALEGVDLLYINMPFMVGRKALKIARKKHIPVVASFHCQAENFSSHIFMKNSRLVNHLVYLNFYYHFYKYVNCIHYPTTFIKETFENAVKHSLDSVVISNGVNSLYQRIDVIKDPCFIDKFNILFIGRFSKEKSHELLIKAVAKSQFKDQIQLVFAGAGPREEYLKKLAKKLNINMPIMRFYKREELVKVINSVDLYVHPSEIEIEAISCLEAITCGLVPVISDSPRSATKAFALDDKNLFSYRSIIDLKDKIEYWYTHPKEKEERQKEYLTFATHFEQRHCMKQMREMFFKTIEEYEK